MLDISLYVIRYIFICEPALCPVLYYAVSELSTGRMDPPVGSGRVGSGRVTILPDFGGSGRVGSALRIF